MQISARYLLRALTVVAVTTTLSVFGSDVVQAQEGRAVRARAVAKNLDNPSGVAVHRSGAAFVATHQGVVRVSFKKGEEPQVATAIGGFKTDVYGKGPKYNIGPLGLGFLNNQQLVVGDGSRPDGEELVRIYKISDEAQTEDDAVKTLGPITAGDESARGEGNYYGIAVGEGAIYVTCNGDDTKGWVSRAEVNGRKVAALKPFIATKEAVGVDAPVGITMSPDGKDLVISQMGEMNVPGDSLLTIYDAASGKLKAKYETGLSDIAGVAYSPTSGKLYAVDFSWSDTSKGGLFELTIDGESVKATKILGLDKPTALAFNRSGALYITEFGTAAEGSDKPAGRLLRVRKGL